MGTNYYIEWRPPQAEAVSINLHVCKSLCMFNGQMFASWRDWRKFLTHNEERLTLTDEYGKEHAVTDFVRDVEEIPLERRGRQANYVLAHYPPDGRDWLDPDGYSFHRGEFS